MRIQMNFKKPAQQESPLSLGSSRSWRVDLSCWSLLDNILAVNLYLFYLQWCNKTF